MCGDLCRVMTQHRFVPAIRRGSRRWSTGGVLSCAHLMGPCFRLRRWRLLGIVDGGRRPCRCVWGRPVVKALSRSLMAPCSRCQALNDLRPVRFSSEAVQGVSAVSGVAPSPQTVRKNLESPPHLANTGQHSNSPSSACSRRSQYFSTTSKHQSSVHQLPLKAARSLGRSALSPHRVRKNHRRHQRGSSGAGLLLSVRP